MFDIIYVTYNSSKWIEQCFKSLSGSKYDTREMNIYIVDNASTDDTLEKLEKVKLNIGKEFGDFSIIKSKENLGFGRANNVAFKEGNSEFVCFINIDTEVFEDTIFNLQKEIEKSKDEVAIWEMRQFPYEHPKLYDPLTGYTSWSSGAAFAIRRNVFEKVNGFDEKIFMYAEDVDLSWRIRTLGYKLKYCPKVTIKHYSYESAGEIKPNQYINSVINNLLLRYRFADTKTIIRGHKEFWKIMCCKSVFQGSRKMLLKRYIKHFTDILYFSKYRKKVKKSKECFLFLNWDYEAIRDGAFYENNFSINQPLVSIIVRTCGRPAVLRETLVSLKNQTYKNIEIVIVEDGEDISRKMIESEFADLNIVYQATKEKVGRSKAGNIAMEIASGKYLNFLDDDDLFYADHVEVLVYNILKSKNRAVYAFAFETPIDIKSKEPYVYELGDYIGIHKQKFDKIMLCHHNYIPIQCIMFEKSLFEEYGGLDEKLDALEDWDLWVRYSLYTDFDCVEKTTSIYRVPMLRNISEKRQKELDEALISVRNKHKTYTQKVSVFDIAMMYER